MNTTAREKKAIGRVIQGEAALAGSAAGGERGTRAVGDAARRLDGWKAIASFLGRSIRTVQRWEQDVAMPVRRVGGGRQGPVWADASELEAWLRGYQHHTRDVACERAAAADTGVAAEHRPGIPAGGTTSGPRPAGREQSSHSTEARPSRHAFWATIRRWLDLTRRAFA